MGIRAAALAVLAVIGLTAAGTVGARGQQAVQAEPLRFSVAIKKRAVDAAQQQITVHQGDALELTFTCDEAAELHLHGYDKLVNVTPDAPAKLSLKADIAGRFSLEAHRFGGAGGNASKARRGHAALLYLHVYTP